MDGRLIVTNDYTELDVFCKGNAQSLIALEILHRCNAYDDLLTAAKAIIEDVPVEKIEDIVGVFEIHGNRLQTLKQAVTQAEKKD